LGCLIAFIIIVLLCSGGSVVGTLLGFGLGMGGSFRNSATEPAMQVLLLSIEEATIALLSRPKSTQASEET
jgi:hypothetical protein